jgi:hypothetical protein
VSIRDAGLTLFLSNPLRARLAIEISRGIIEKDGITDKVTPACPPNEEVGFPKFSCSIDQGLVGNRELKVLAQDVKDDADKPRSEMV